MQVITETLFHIITYQTLKWKTSNILIDGKSFFELPVNNEEEAYEKIIEMSNNNNYTTGNLLDFAYFKKYYKLIAIDLSKQTKLKDPQQINFIGKLENQDHGAAMFFIIEKPEETTFNFSQNIVTIIQIMETQFIKKFWQWKFKICNKKMVRYWQWNKRCLLTRRWNQIFNKFIRIKSLCLFWCIYFSHRKHYCCWWWCKYKSCI